MALPVLLGLAQAASAEEAIEEIVVTGSYIRGTPQDAASPVQVLDREAMVTSGASDMAEIFRNLEIASGSDTAPSDGGRFNGRSGSGLANVSLRGLGPTATLVLMDGKRLPFAGQKLGDGDRFVDINNIPITMIERVEVLKDGGSALYGSDAIAGVVNFITRNDFQGFEVTGKFQSTTGEDQDDATLGMIWGWSSDDERTHFVIGGEYFDRSLMESSQRRDLRGSRLYAKQDPAPNPVVRSSAFVPIPGFRPDAGDPQCELLGYFRDNADATDPTACNRHVVETDVMIPEAERESVMIVGSHMFSEAAEVYTQLSYAHTKSGSSRNVHNGPIEPKFFFPSLIGSTSTSVFTTGTVPWSTDPFAGGAPGDPSVIANGGPLPASPIPGVALPLDLVDFELRSPGIEPDRKFESHNDQVTTRYQLGVRGDFTWGERPWNYDFSLTRGDSRWETNFLGIDKNRLELALYGLGGPSCVPNGSIAFGDPRADTARFLLAGADGVISPDGLQGPLEGLLNAVNGNVDGFPTLNADNLLLAMTSDNQGTGGCEFYNPYLTRSSTDPLTGPALTNSAELLQWLEVPQQGANESETYLNAVDFVLSGELFDMSAGPVGVAFGLQYREEGRETRILEQTLGTVNSFGQLAGAESVAGASENRNFDEDRDIFAAFLELQAPITDKLDVQFAVRYEDYGGSIGDTVDPKLGLRFQPIESLVLRGSIGTSFRGPGLAQVEEGTGFSLEFGVRDRLGERGDAVGAVNGSNCVRTGQCALPDFDAAPSIIIVKRGLASPDLAPEEATTFNLGAIWSPTSGPLEGLEIGIDYYNIEFEDKIIDVPTQSFLTDELAAFQAAKAAGNYVIVEPTAGDFLQACDPADPAFQFAGGGARAEQCQVDPRAYESLSIQRRTDLSRDLQIIRGSAINTGRGRDRRCRPELLVSFPRVELGHVHADRQPELDPRIRSIRLSGWPARFRRGGFHKPGSRKAPGAFDARPERQRCVVLGQRQKSGIVEHALHRQLRRQCGAGAAPGTEFRPVLRVRRPVYVPAGPRR